MTEAHIRATLAAYLDRYPEDKSRLAPVSALLDSGADLGSRTEFRGHATAGAVLVDADGRILHIHHLALSRWLLPGGHLEPSDRSLADAALRELVEETGIDEGSVFLACDVPVDVDVHPIPANEAKREPEHQHVDFRYLFRTHAGVGQLQAEEITDAAWRELSDLRDERLRHRLASSLPETDLAPPASTWPPARS